MKIQETPFLGNGIRHWIKFMMWVLSPLFILSAAFAQMGGGDEGRGGMMGGMKMQEMMSMHDMGMDMDGGMMKMMKAASRLDLTPDQRKQAQRLKLKHQKEAIPLLARIRMADVEVRELSLADPVNLEKVKTKIKEKHDAVADLELSHLTAMQQFKALLTPEQREKMESMMMGPTARDEKIPMGAPGEAHPDMPESRGR